MPEELLPGYAEVAVFLEAVVEEVLDGPGSAVTRFALCGKARASGRGSGMRACFKGSMTVRPTLLNNCCG